MTCTDKMVLCLFNSPHFEKKNMEVAIFRHWWFSFLKVWPKHDRILENCLLSIMTCSRGEFKFGSFLLWIATRFGRWHGNRSRWWIVRPSVRLSVILALSLSVLRALISVAALSQTDVTVVAGSWYLHGEGWRGKDPGQGKQTTPVSAESQCFFFFSFFWYRNFGEI